MKILKEIRSNLIQLWDWEEMTISAQKVGPYLIPLLVGNIANFVILRDESHPHYNLARYLFLAYWSVCVPATFYSVISMLNRELVKELKAASVEPAFTLALHDPMASGKARAAVLFIPFAAGLIHFTMLPDDDDKLESATYLSLGYATACMLFIFCLQTVVPSVRLNKFVQDRNRILELQPSSASSVPTEPTRLDKHD